MLAKYAESKPQNKIALPTNQSWDITPEIIANSKEKTTTKMFLLLILEFLVLIIINYVVDPTSRSYDRVIGW